MKKFGPYLWMTGLALTFCCYSCNNEPNSTTTPATETTTPAANKPADAKRSKGKDWKGIPTTNNTKAEPAPGMLKAAMIAKLGKERCAICARYTCIESGSTYKSGDRQHLGYSCTERRWKTGCPLFVKTEDGAIWELDNDCNKC